jgi:hypothetical protein
VLRGGLGGLGECGGGVDDGIFGERKMLGFGYLR